MWLLDEEAIFPGSTDESFVERLLLQHSDRNSEDLIKKGPTESHFILQHFQGTNPVLYNSAGWLKSSRESPNAKTSVQLLHESADRNLSGEPSLALVRSNFKTILLQICWRQPE